MNKTSNLLAWVLQLVAAAILGQTLFYKFRAAPESVHIFETLGAEPWGRIGSGIVELVAVLLLLRPRTAALGGLLAAGTMAAAIGAHLTKLGIEVQGDGGLLFALAVTTLVAGLAVAFLRRASIARAARAVLGGRRPERLSSGMGKRESR